MWRKITVIKNSILKRRGFIKFLGVGSVNTAVDFLIFSLLANLLSVYPPIASIVSTGLTLILSFYLNHRFVFRSTRRPRAVALQFVAITLFNVWVIQTVVITVAIHILMPYTFFIDHEWTLNSVAKIAGVAVSFMLNFVGYRYIFKERYRNDTKK